MCSVGNLKMGDPKGFHSRPSGTNPSTIANLRITQPANAQGIYGARWAYRGHADLPKFSTFFPDRCNTNQVLQSIAYAANHLSACPEGAPSWARCGVNQPSGGNTARYCTANNGSSFAIALGLLNDGRVNTAFPCAKAMTSEPAFTWPGHRVEDPAHQQLHAFLVLDLQRSPTWIQGRLREGGSAAIAAAHPMAALGQCLCPQPLAPQCSD